MKRREKSFLSFVLTAVMILAVMPVFSFPMKTKAETTADGLFEYSVNDGKITITKFIGEGKGDIVIPSEIDGKPVVEIGSGAFEGCNALNSVKFSGDVGDIGESAFEGCNALDSVIFEGEVGNIGKNAFVGCSVTGLKFSGDVGNIGESAFKSCNLGFLSFPGNVGDIGESAFNGCNALEIVEFYGDVGNIGESAFAGCLALLDFLFSGEVGDIGKNAFNGCEKIIYISFPRDVGNIGESAFAGCSSLDHFNFYGDVGNIGKSAFNGCSALQEVFIKGDVGNIGKSAFNGCNTLFLVAFLGNVGDLGESVFAGCSVNRVDFDGEVGNIGKNAFNGCENIKSIYFPEDVGDIGESAFAGCSGLKDVDFKGEVGNIGENAFKDCTGLKYVIIPQTSIINAGGFSPNTEVIKYGFESNTYTGQTIPFVVKVNGVVDPSIYYTVTYEDAKEVKDARDYTAKFTMQYPYSDWAKIKHTVNQLDLSKCTVDFGDATFTYDGKDQKERVKEAIKILNVENKEIKIIESDYTFEFQKKDGNNWNKVTECIEPGDYSIKINGDSANCCSYVKKSFKITKSINDQSIKILPVSAYTYNGQEIKPSVTVKDENKELVKDQDYTVEYIDNTNVSRDESGNVIAGAKIKIKGIGNYDSERTESFTISPKALTITADSDTKCEGSTLIKESCTCTGLAEGDYLDSVKITGSQTDVGTSENVPRDAVIKNRKGEDVTSCYNIKYVNGTLTVENHAFDRKVATDTYLAEEADFTHAARYYYSCKCRKKGTETFEAGEPLPTYTIIFDANGGNIESVSADTNAEYKLDSLPTPEYDGYNFLGWFTNETGGDEITTSIVFGANMTIYAHWEKKEEPKPAQGGTEKPETPSEPSVPETPSTPETPATPETPSELETPETEDVKEETKSDYLDELYALLREAIAKGEEQTINWSVGDSLPYDVMKILEENPQITLVFNYTYMGEDFNVTIRGRDVQADPKVKWCGPLYLYSIYGGYKGDENGLKESGTYIVQAGDTLSALAAKFNTTIKNLVALNNIKDENLIFIGQELKY